MLRRFAALATALSAAPLVLASTVADARTAPAAAVAKGVVSAADPRAAAAGVQILRQGGSATDAAIAVMLALNVVEPQSSGIGGGGFMLWANRAGQIESYDGREAAPAAATQAWFLDAGGKPLPFPRAVQSGLSVGVPGNLRLAFEAHKRHGKLAWAALFAPAIALARDGFAITERGREFLVLGKDRAAADPYGRSLFFDAAGEPVAAGTVVRNPALAATFERIARGGPGAFYGGAFAQALAAHVAAATPRPAGLAAADLAAYAAKVRPALCGRYRGYRICGMGPPSSGETTVYAILKQLERFDLARLGPQSPVAWHLFAESQRLAYADRDAFLADGDFVRVPVAGLMDPAYLARRGALIGEGARLAHVTAGAPAGASEALRAGSGPEEHGTSDFAVTDRHGEAISYTSTIEGPFGSGLMAGGFYLNNELTDFSFAPVADGVPVANRVAGGKRPRSAMAPTVVFDPGGRLFLVIGAAGGATIPVQVAKALIGVIDWHLPADKAIALPMLYAPGGVDSIEPGSPLLALKPQLEALGHHLVERPLPLKANAIEWLGGHWVGAADPRSEGAAVSE